MSKETDKTVISLTVGLTILVVLIFTFVCISGTLYEQEIDRTVKNEILTNCDYVTKQYDEIIKMYLEADYTLEPPNETLPPHICHKWYKVTIWGLTTSDEKDIVVAHKYLASVFYEKRGTLFPETIIHDCDLVILEVS